MALHASIQLIYFFATGGARTRVHVEGETLKPHHLCQLGYHPNGNSGVLKPKVYQRFSRFKNDQERSRWSPRSKS
ncbi:hypothetical protein RHMOL_Rhmol06G0320200 [Rhododendron molle]|uniref:Uncharacterized protein n=1 Tax=Rhododendron molle TaxID=49168 RepID=A0ACC0NIT8_RHOML|nr:hypothetical protein RHMOL_Rhmol06G0320200 [Rhododendron molle]